MRTERDGDDVVIAISGWSSTSTTAGSRSTELARGTTFTIRLPIDGADSSSFHAA